MEKVKCDVCKKMTDKYKIDSDIGYVCPDCERELSTCGTIEEVDDISKSKRQMVCSKCMNTFPIDKLTYKANKFMCPDCLNAYEKDIFDILLARLGKPSPKIKQVLDAEKAKPKNERMDSKAIIKQWLATGKISEAEIIYLIFANKQYFGGEFEEWLIYHHSKPSSFKEPVKVNLPKENMGPVYVEKENTEVAQKLDELTNICYGYCFTLGKFPSSPEIWHKLATTLGIKYCPKYYWDNYWE